MPIKAQGGVADFELEVRNGSGNFADPDNLTMEFRDSIGAVQDGFPINYPGDIIKDSVGHYHYSWPIPIDFPIGGYTAVWDAILLGAQTTTQEAWEIVLAGSLSLTTGGLDFLSHPEDYDAIRGLLGVTTLDVEDSDIELLAFAPQAEMLVKRRISTWEAQSLEAATMFVLRMATIYQTACLMAQSFVRGGTIGLARPLSTGEGRDWEVAAEAFCNKYEYWINIADQSDPAAENNADFTVDPMVISGPTSVRIAHRQGSAASTDPSTASWWQFPPLWRP